MEDITLPTEMANGGLTLEEIGAMFVLMAMPHLEDSSCWNGHDQLISLMVEFKEEDILVLQDSGEYELDLTWLI